MELGIVGLGRIGPHMARRSARAGVSVEAFDVFAAARAWLLGPNATAVETLSALVKVLAAPRIAGWMLPAGSIQPAERKE